MATIGRSCVEGVGVTYHPFLHDYLLQRAELFDFIELPLDLYADPARSALLDPGQVRLHQVIAAKPCTWRGSALALGSVERGFAPYTLQIVRRLVGMTPGAFYTEVVGFRVPGQGARHAMPFTSAAAIWVAQRQAEAQHMLSTPVQLALPHPARASATEMDPAAFLALIAAHGGSDVVVDAADAACPSDGVLPIAHIAGLSLSSDDAADWDQLCALSTRLHPRTVVLCRDRQLFPLDTIERDLRRIRSLIAAPADAAAGTRPAPVSNHSDADGLAALLDYQRAVTAASNNAQSPSPVGGDAAGSSWQNWRDQVDDMHKAQQIAALLSRSGGPGPSWPA